MSEAWARSGAMWLTGRRDGPPLEVDGDPAGVIESALSELPGDADLPGVRVLSERAALLSLGRQGISTAGGAGRMLPTTDGWVAVSLARPADFELLPALIERAVEDPWPDLARWAGRTAAADIVDRASLLGLPAAAVPEGPRPPRRPGVIRTPGGGAREPRNRSRVLDLSSLWAGPLCAHLLGRLGYDVVKVESIHRPDGARRGDPRFFDLLHAGHRSVALDFGTAEGRATLRHLVSRADVVIEGSRPRALRQFGLHAEDVVAAGTSWISINAYGRAPDDELRVGFGDDVAAGAGLVGRDASGPVFAGDALADPLSGVLAGAAAAAALSHSSAALLDISMHDVAVAAAVTPRTVATGPVALPRPRPATGRAPRLGADTRTVLDSWH